MTTKAPKTHNYTDGNRGWGHDCVFQPMDKGEKATIFGHGLGLQVGDYILISLEGDTTRYRITDLQYKHDPADLWFSKTEFAPRTTEQKKVDFDATTQGKQSWLTLS